MSLSPTSTHPASVGSPYESRRLCSSVTSTTPVWVRILTIFLCGASACLITLGHAVHPSSVHTSTSCSSHASLSESTHPVHIPPPHLVAMLSMVSTTT